MTRAAADASRRILLFAHTGREDARGVARDVVSALSAHGLTVRMLEDEARELQLGPGQQVETVAVADAGSTSMVLAGSYGTAPDCSSSSRRFTSVSGANRSRPRRCSAHETSAGAAVSEDRTAGGWWR